MSKKKAFSGSTMTLKDFHGGSIPSDLPLPSAPGTVPRNFERAGLDRTNPSAWGSPINRSDHRRPGSAGTSRNFDEKTSFFLHPPHIGRNFDEDERKPLDSGSRRSSGDDDGFSYSRSDRISHDHPDPKPSETKASSRIQMTVNQAPNPHTFNVPGRTVSANGNPMGVPNAWARNDVVSMGDPSQTSLRPAPSASAASKLACASAIDKVSSGIWQSKLVISSSHQSQTSIYPPELQHKEPEIESDIYLGNSRYTEINRLQAHSLEVESSPAVDMGQAVGRGRYNENRPYVADLVPSRTEEFGGNNKERSRLARTISTEGKLGAQQQDEALERPKLKLLPRTKPMEPQNSYIDGYKEIPQQYKSGNAETCETIRLPASDLPVVDENSKTAERSRLNLKPRSQPSDQSEEDTSEKESTPPQVGKGKISNLKNIFGGARPRELVLKARGIDDVAVIGSDPVQPHSRGKPELHMPDVKTDVTAQHFRHSDRVEISITEQRAGYRLEHADRQPDRREIERKDNRDAEKADTQRGSRRNDNWRDDRNVEKPQEIQKEPERWRKSEPIASQDTQTLHYGRAASAVDLVQAFSGSVSSAGKPEVLSNTRSLPNRLKDSGSVPGRSSVPFSRLLESGELYARSKERRINGY